MGYRSTQGDIPEDHFESNPGEQTDEKAKLSKVLLDHLETLQREQARYIKRPKP